MSDLENLLDTLSETCIYVIEEKSHRLLYFNCLSSDTSYGSAALGKICSEVWPELCANCPLNAMEKDLPGHIICYSPLLKATADITATRIIWGENTPAVAVVARPHQLNMSGKQVLRKVEQVYVKSLVTVFDECIIVNLSEDYYVNCQKDPLWSGIPEQGDFGEENRRYAKKAVHPDDRQSFLRAFSREAMLKFFGEGKKKITRRLRRMTESGAYHMVEFTATRIEQLGDEQYWCVLVYRDIQEEYQLEQQRNLEVSQLATAARSAYQMVIAVNLTQNTYHMLEYNRFPVKNPGVKGTFQDLIRSELSTVHPNYREEFLQKFSHASLIDAFSRGNHIVSMEVPHLGDDGSCHWNFTQVVHVDTPYTDDMIEITLSRNIDEDRRVQKEALEKERRSKQLLEEALEKAEKASSAKSDFLSKMSHDIRTPLNAILGMTELAQRHTGEEDKLKDYLGKISASGTHLLGLINEVLDVSKIESGSVQLANENFSMNHLVQETAELVRLSMERKHQTFSLTTAQGLHDQVLGDNQRLKQVLVNLLDNASKYTDDGGRITHSVAELEKQDQRMGSYCFVVEDNGIGMKPDYLEHIFEPFSRAYDSRLSKIPGTGLGMTIVKNLISMMGGTIQVESEYGKGTRFTVLLPLEKCAAPVFTDASCPTAAEETFPGLRALLVEDNELNRHIAKEMLELLLVAVDTAENGQEAVEAIRNHAPLYYDIVFMDVQMPVLNGYEATREIRNSGMDRIGELPILAMTADAFAEDVKKALVAGMNGHLAKPISIDGLKNALSNCQAWKQRNSEQSPAQ